MNPFKVLNIDPAATAPEVMQAASLALREKRYSAREIAEARQLLMDPAARPVLAFLHFADVEPLLRLSGKTEKELTEGAAALCRLEIFD